MIIEDYEPLQNEFCTKCGSTLYWVDCYNCEDGYSYHACGEDSCCCIDPENNVTCDVCMGNAGWRQCVNDECTQNE